LYTIIIIIIIIVTIKNVVVVVVMKRGWLVACGLVSQGSRGISSLNSTTRRVQRNVELTIAAGLAPHSQASGIAPPHLARGGSQQLFVAVVEVHKGPEQVAQVLCAEGADLGNCSRCDQRRQALAGGVLELRGRSNGQVTVRWVAKDAQSDGVRAHREAG